ncbi:MAG: DUF4445 domain-containing protein [Desulfobacteraceae bacterium]|nr:MAG: DUF4445 domain-containing protein [Desulfobacteraceae bacterium]
MKVLFQPMHRSVDVQRGVQVLKAAQKAGIVLYAPCGGIGRCGKCKVIVGRGVAAVTPREREFLNPSEIRDKVRLACQTTILASTSVSIISLPEERDQILEDGISPPVRLVPAVKKYFLCMTPENFRRQRSAAEILEDLIARQHLRQPSIPFQILKTFPLHVSRSQRGVTVTLSGDEVIGFEPGDTTGELYGLAVDVGTTTVVGYLFDLNEGGVTAVSSSHNDQAIHGADVISRINHALDTEEGLTRLHQAILCTINRIIDDLCAHSGIASEYIYCLVMVGNTAMNHFFWGISPHFLSRSPFNPLIKESLKVSSRNFGLKMNPSGAIISLPLISGFIGSDTVGVVLSTGLHRSRVPKMALDIGTNGEIVLTDGKSMIACSCAAGPAFEGAHIQCGMRGCSGAIDLVAFVGDKIDCHVIDEVAPKGICGSGLVDTIAEMLREGIIDRDGRLLSPEEIPNPAYASMIRYGSFREFVLSSRAEGPAGSERNEIVVTQKDIREFQLAKGAMMAGIRILMKSLDLSEEDIREVYLAGAFGNYLQTRSAIAVGLLPPFPNARITQIGNAAAGGAKMALLSSVSLDEAKRIARRIQYIELAKAEEFQDEFIQGMILPR